MVNTKVVIYCALGLLIVVFLSGYVFSKKYLEPKIVDKSVAKVQETIDQNYGTRIENINGQIRTIDGKIGTVEKKRQQVAKDVDDLKRKRKETAPTATAEEAVKTLKELGYDVIIVKK